MAQAQLDPRIPLSIEPIKFPTPDELEARKLKIEQARQVRQATIDAAAGRAAVQQAFQTYTTPDGPDFKAITGSLYKAGRYNEAKAIDEAVTKMRKESADTEALELKNQNEEATYVAQLMDGVDESSYPTRYERLKARDPKGAELLGPTFDKQKVEAAVAAATTISEHNKQIKEATDLALSGKIQEAMGREVDLVPNDPEAWSQFRAKYIHFGADPNTIPQQPSPEARAAIKDAAISQEKKAELASQEATRAQTVANQAVIEQRERDRMAQQASQFQQTFKLNSQRLGLEQQRERRLEGDQTGPAKPIDPNAPHGEDFLKTLPPNKQAIVKSLAEGRQPWPSSFAMKGAYWQDILESVFQYDPTMDTAQVSNNSRVKVRNDFTSGKSAQQVNALNTVIGHLGTLDEKVSDLGNTDYRSVNAVRNWLKTQSGNPSVNNFEAAKEAVASELVRVWRQSGGSENDIQAWKGTLNAASSPQQLRGAMSTIGHLLESKLESMNQQYQQGMGTTSVNVITPAARKALDRLEGVKSGQSSSKAYTGEVRQSANGRMLGLVNGQPVEVVRSGNGWVVK